MRKQKKTYKRLVTSEKKISSKNQNVKQMFTGPNNFFQINENNTCEISSKESKQCEYETETKMNE
jgi:hypothetical protein